MFEAYEVHHLIKKIPTAFCVESLYIHDNFIFAGTKNGCILIYPIKTSENRYDVELVYKYELIAKKSVTQIEYVPEFHMLICLCDNKITILDFVNSELAPLCTVHETKGTHSFTAQVLKYEVYKETLKTLRLCVAIKKKLQFFYWKTETGGFLQHSEDINLPDVPHKVVWYDNNLCVGFKSEYALVDLSSGAMKELYPVGSNQPKPLITILPNKKLAAGYDNQTVIFNPPFSKDLIKWSQIPIATAYSEPYLISVLLSSSVEIYSIEADLSIQITEQLPQSKLIALSNRSGFVFVASGSDVWMLKSVDLRKQVSHFTSINQFELAYQLAKMMDRPEDAEIVWNAEKQYALCLFMKLKFEEAMKLFFKLEGDPAHVIALFPDLLPEEMRQQLNLPDTLPILQEEDLDKGIFFLTKYLTEVRERLKREEGAMLSMNAIFNKRLKSESKENLLQIIDTVLLKCYLKINYGLVIPLLRMEDSHCRFDECEKILNERQKYNELVILYSKNGKHKEALDVLMREAKERISPLQGPERIIHYLQNLGQDHLPLIFEYSKWVFKEYPKYGLQIFDDELRNGGYIPHEKVYAFLESAAPGLILPYLEQIVTLHHTSWKFHDDLIHKYMEKITELQKECIIPPQSSCPTIVVSKFEELKKLRSKFIKFLQTSQRYTVESVPTYLFRDPNRGHSYHDTKSSRKLVSFDFAK